ncbi:ABC transporter substrate-binding protein [Streptomyces sp. SID3343]|uniref:ABC transporter substrate-binding protein n=1 Tax=Streptomyces sp. SID3343 TaxID=2690260 RepID=UPI0031F92797
MVPHPKTRSRPRHPRVRRRLSLGLALAAATLVATVGCGLGSSESNSSAKGPRHGGSLTILLPGEERGLDPFTASYSNVADGNRLSALYDVLVWTDPTTGGVHPKLAESLVSDQSAKVWTLTLREGVKFSDGSLLDAATVKANWEAHRNPEVRSLVGGVLRDVVLTEVAPLQLRIELPSSNANFDHTVARNLSFVAPKRLVATPDGRFELKHAPIGAGPYKLKEWLPGRELRLERNPDYWQKDRPYLDEVVFRVDKDVEGANKAIQAKKADLTITTDAQNIAAAREMGLVGEDSRLNGGLMVAFNTRKPPFQDPAARRAVVLGLSGAEIDRRYFGGRGNSAQGIFDSRSPLANINLSAPENRPEEARALFAKLTNDGKKPFVFRYLVPDSPKPRQVAEYIRQTLEQYPAVTVIVEVADMASLVTRASGNDFDSTVFQLWADDVEPTIYQFLHSKGGLSNVTGYANDIVDAALEDGRRYTDAASRRDAYTRLQNQVNRDLPYWVYSEAVSASVHRPDLIGIQLFNDGLIHFDAIGLRP